MPTAALRPCAGGCGARVPSGRCAACAARVEQRRGSAHARGYTHAWALFRPQFIAALVYSGVVPTCGASLPTGPHSSDSRCLTQGLHVFANEDGSDLHLDHEPPLAEAERSDISIVCDPQRIQLLCRTCHAAKTRREQLVER